MHIKQGKSERGWMIVNILVVISYYSYEVITIGANCIRILVFFLIIIEEATIISKIKSLIKITPSTIFSVSGVCHQSVLSLNFQNVYVLVIKLNCVSWNIFFFEQLYNNLHDQNILNNCNSGTWHSTTFSSSVFLKTHDSVWEKPCHWPLPFIRCMLQSSTWMGSALITCACSGEILYLLV